MIAAQEDAVLGIDGTAYSNDSNNAFVAAKSHKWVFQPDDEALINGFLEKGIFSHPTEDNFVIKASEKK